MADVQGRRALIIGSECLTQRTLGFVHHLAAELHGELTTRGGWRSALNDDGPVINPTITQLKEVVKSAFAAANAERATLLIAFIGHGLTTGSQDFHLLALDSPNEPDSETAYHLTQGIHERLNYAPFLDGLIVLVDACEAGQAVAGAANRWLDVQGSGGRIELLVASGEGSAYDGCFTRKLTTALRAGVAAAGEYLLCADIESRIAECERQRHRRLSLSSGGAPQGDPGLWLVPNVARHRDAVAGRSSAGVVDQLTRGVVITDVIREYLAELVAADQSSRLRIVVGSSGCGKSTLLSLLIRPALVDTLDIAATYITAAAFLDASSTLESLTEELSGQLAARIPQFTKSRASVDAELKDSPNDQRATTSFEREVVMPLKRCRTAGRRVRIVIDGLEQPEQGRRDLILSAIAELTRDTANDLEHVRVIAGVRSGVGVDTRHELEHAHRIALDPPAQDDVRRVGQAVPTTLPATSSPVGGWLLARLVREAQETAPETRPWDMSAAVTLDAVVEVRFANALHRMREPGAGVLLTSLLVAAGVGPVLPIELAAKILRLQHPSTLTRDVVVELGALISRGKPGSPEEAVGIAHSEFCGALETAVVQHAERLLTQAGAETRLVSAAKESFLKAAHATILLALSELESAGETTPNIATYTKTAAPRHYLAIGEADMAISALVALTTFRAADDRDRWESWLPILEEQLGSDHPATFIARNNHAFWRGEAGDVLGAVAELEEMVPRQKQALGDDDLNTFVSRNNLARWRGQAGDVAGAIAELKVLLADRIRVLGEDHPDTLVTRNQLAGWQGEIGAAAPAVTELESVVRELQRVVGEDHPNTLAARENLARRRRAAGDISRAIAEYGAVLADRIRVQGEDHPDTLGTRNDFAELRLEGGDVAGAIADYELLLRTLPRVLGEDHPHTLAARGNLAVCRAQAGDVARAISELDVVLGEQQRLLSMDHLHTLTTRRNLALLRKETMKINLATATVELEEVLRGHQRARRADHPETLTVRAYLATWRGEGGNFARAVAELTAVLADQIRVLGPTHPHIFATRGNLANCRGRAGDVAGAIRGFEVLLTDVTQVLGANHPHTQTIRRNLEYWRRQRGALRER